MTREEADAIITTIQTFVGGERGGGKAERLAQGRDGSTLVRQPSGTGVQTVALPKGSGLAREVIVQPLVTSTKEKLFEEFKAWLLSDLQEDPVFVRLLAQRPELEIEFTPRRVTLQGDKLNGRVARLMAAGWFAGTRTVGACRTELKRTGADPGGGGALYNVFAEFVRDGFLVRDGDGYTLAPSVKITEREVVSE